MSVSEWFSDDELLSQLMMFFDIEEMENIDFKECLGLISEIDEDTREIRFKNRVFRFSMTSCNVIEVD